MELLSLPLKRDAMQACSSRLVSEPALQKPTKDLGASVSLSLLCMSYWYRPMMRECTIPEGRSERRSELEPSLLIRAKEEEEEAKCTPDLVDATIHLIRPKVDGLMRLSTSWALVIFNAMARHEFLRT